MEVLNHSNFTVKNTYKYRLVDDIEWIWELLSSKIFRISTIYLEHVRLNKVNISNDDGKKVCYCVWLHARLFYIQSKLLLYMHNPWTLLFQMVYELPFYLKCCDAEISRLSKRPPSVVIRKQFSGDDAQRNYCS